MVLVYAPVALFAVTSVILGRLILASHKDPGLLWHERVSLDFLIGAGALSTLVYLLAHFGLARKGAFVTLSIVVIGTILIRPFRLNADTLVPARSLIPLLVTAVFLAVYFAYASGAEHSPDAMEYHLAFVDRHKRLHRYAPLLDAYQAGFPQLSGMAFLFCVCH